MKPPRDARDQLAYDEFIRRQIAQGRNSEQILETEFEPVRWIVPGFVSPGLTLLAGAPKIGKSWLIMGMASAIACGGRVFGEVKVEQGRVLALFLEDTERRIKERLQKMWIRGSTSLDIRTKWPSGKEGLAWLDLWLREYDGTSVIFIDTLQRLAAIAETNSYKETYDAAAGIKDLADRYGVAIIAIHHTSKFIHQDFVSSVNGSVGLTGAADTIITMQRLRLSAEGVLSVTGRDVEEKEYGIRFDSTIGSWSLMDHVPKERPAWGDPKSGRKKKEKQDGKEAAAGGNT